MTKKKPPAKKLRAIMLADDTLLPEGELKDFSEKQRELRKPSSMSVMRWWS